MTSLTSPNTSSYAGPHTQRSEVMNSHTQTHMLGRQSRETSPQPSWTSSLFACSHPRFWGIPGNCKQIVISRGKLTISKFKLTHAGLHVPRSDCECGNAKSSQLGQARQGARAQTLCTYSQNCRRTPSTAQRRPWKSTTLRRTGQVDPSLEAKTYSRYVDYV